MKWFSLVHVQDLDSTSFFEGRQIYIWSDSINASKLLPDFIFVFRSYFPLILHLLMHPKLLFITPVQIGSDLVMPSCSGILFSPYSVGSIWANLSRQCKSIFHAFNSSNLTFRLFVFSILMCSLLGMMIFIASLQPLDDMWSIIIALVYLWCHTRIYSIFLSVSFSNSSSTFFCSGSETVSCRLHQRIWSIITCEFSYICFDITTWRLWVQLWCWQAMQHFGQIQFSSRCL